MANRVLALMGSNKVSLEIATEITLKGKTVAKRMIDAIDPDIIKVVAQKVERAWDGDVMFSPDDKAKIKNVQITSMPHEDSPTDSASHISISTTDADGNLYKKAHVSINSLQQQPWR